MHLVEGQQVEVLEADRHGEQQPVALRIALADREEVLQAHSSSSWLTAAIPMDSPYCGCKLTRVRHAVKVCSRISDLEFFVGKTKVRRRRRTRTPKTRRTTRKDSRHNLEGDAGSRQRQQFPRTATHKQLPRTTQRVFYGTFSRKPGRGWNVSKNVSAQVSC